MSRVRFSSYLCHRYLTSGTETKEPSRALTGIVTAMQESPVGGVKWNVNVCIVGDMPVKYATSFTRHSSVESGSMRSFLK